MRKHQARKDHVSKMEAAGLAVHNGQPVKALVVKIFQPGKAIGSGKVQYSTHHVRAQRGMVFKASGIEEALGKFAEQIELAHPGHEYTVKCVGSGAYNFVWVSGPDAEVA